MSIDLNALAAQRRALMDGIVILNPRLREAHNKFEFLMEHGRCKANREKLCLPLIAKTQSGKSTIIQSFAMLKNTKEALERRQIPVLHVTLEANTTRKGLAHNILEAIEEYGWQAAASLSRKGNETILLQRVRNALRLAQVELLVLDEFHHLVHSDRDNVAFSVGETIKRMLIKGVCPIVMSGIEDARRIFTKNRQLLYRAHSPVALAPLTMTNPADQKLFLEFITGYLKALEKRRVARNATNLLQGDVPICIHEVSQGVLGAACNLIKSAVEIMTYAQRDEITRDDLVAANDEAISLGLYDRNPFLHGPGPIRPVT